MERSRVRVVEKGYLYISLLLSLCLYSSNMNNYVNFDVLLVLVEGAIYPPLNRVHSYGLCHT
jgi:hypothetical protein